MTFWRIIEGECVAAMAAMPEASVDAIVTDPPYGLGFMGHEWDQPGKHAPLSAAHGGCNVSYGGAPHPAMEVGRYDLTASGNWRFQEWCEAWAVEALRVLKPGGHLVAFGGPRTYHRLACGIEDAGFEIRDKLAWLFGSGFPKSLNVAKAIEKHARPLARSWLAGAYGTPAANTRADTLLAELVQLGEQQAEHAGAGTALKPGHEPIVLARKPFRGTVAANVLQHGTGAINVDGCRIAGGERPVMIRTGTVVAASSMSGESTGATASGETTTLGRWPANVVMDEDAAAELDAQTGDMRDGVAVNRNREVGAHSGNAIYGARNAADTRDVGYGGSGGASRFFYTAKASSAERGSGNSHPTVKPVELMRWLCRLITPKGGTILDPFTGSGTTGIAALREGFAFVGIEREAEYAQIARARIIGDAPLFNSASEKAA